MYLLLLLDINWSVLGQRFSKVLIQELIDAIVKIEKYPFVLGFSIYI